MLFRSHKRYYYQNRTTGVSQWEYPQPDIQNCDDAMDISTTPPPEHAITMSPPLPPTIRSPTPPPPPIISGVDDNVNKSKKEMLYSIHGLFFGSSNWIQMVANDCKNQVKLFCDFR